MATKAKLSSNPAYVMKDSVAPSDNNDYLSTDEDEPVKEEVSRQLLIFLEIMILPMLTTVCFS